jgi:rubredoxin
MNYICLNCGEIYNEEDFVNDLSIELICPECKLPGLEEIDDN